MLSKSSEYDYNIPVPGLLVYLDEYRYLRGYSIQIRNPNRVEMIYHNDNPFYRVKDKDDTVFISNEAIKECESEIQKWIKQKYSINCKELEINVTGDKLSITIAYSKHVKDIEDLSFLIMNKVTISDLFIKEMILPKNSSFVQFIKYLLFMLVKQIIRSVNDKKYKIYLHEYLLCELLSSYLMNGLTEECNEKMMRDWLKEPNGKLAAYLVYNFDMSLFNNFFYNTSRINKKIKLLKRCIGKYEQQEEDFYGLLYDSIYNYYDKCCGLFKYDKLHANPPLHNGLKLGAFIAQELKVAVNKEKLRCIFAIACCQNEYSLLSSTNGFIRSLLIDKEEDEEFLYKVHNILTKQSLYVDRNLYISNKLTFNSIMRELGIADHQKCTSQRLINSAKDFIEKRYKSYIDLYKMETVRINIHAETTCISNTLDTTRGMIKGKKKEGIREIHNVVVNSVSSTAIGI
ncbi:hypothetical protein K6025_02865 [Ehrlichia sp. JZT12]